MTGYLRPLPLGWLVLGLTAFVFTVSGPPRVAHAYSYAVARNEPLLDGREALFQAAESGFWTAARITLQSMQDDIDRVEQTSPGVSDAFDIAVTAKDAAALRAAFLRVARAEIIRRLDIARDSVFNYEVAKLEVAGANRFYIAVAADLDPVVSKIVARQMQVALDAIGTPGVLGVGFVPANREAFDAARQAIADALGQTAE